MGLIKVCFSFLDTVTGVAVGMLLLGVILGVVFTCIGLKNFVKKPKQGAFQDDHDGHMDEFLDDDPNL